MRVHSGGFSHDEVGSSIVNVAIGEEGLASGLVTASQSIYLNMHHMTIIIIII